MTDLIRNDSVMTAVDYMCETISFGEVMLANRDLADVIGIGLPQLREAVAILKAHRIVEVNPGKRKVVIADPLASEEHY